MATSAREEVLHSCGFGDGKTSAGTRLRFSRCSSSRSIHWTSPVTPELLNVQSPAAAPGNR
jgi:hypothetical protein